MAEIELEFREINKWALEQLRKSVLHIQNFFNHVTTMNCKLLLLCITLYYTCALADLQSGICSCSTSRFLISLLKMLTIENKSVDLSMFINEGLLGLVQSILK